MILLLMYSRTFSSGGTDPGRQAFFLGGGGVGEEGRLYSR